MPAVRAPAPDRSWVALLGLASGLSSFGMASIVPALPVLGRSLDAPFAELQLLVSGYLLGLGLAQPVHGLLADRFGRRPVLLGGFAVFGLASLGACFAHSLALLVLARFLQAAGASVGTVCARAIVRDTHEPEGAAVALSFIAAVMGISPVIAPLVGGIVTDLWGWRAIFAAHVVVAVAVFTWMALVLPETRPAGVHATTARAVLASFGGLLRDRGFMGYTLNYGFTTAIGFTFLTIGAALFAQLFAMSGSAFGMLWSCLALSYSAGAWLAGRGSRRSGARRMFSRGATLMVLGCVVFMAATVTQQPLRVIYFSALVIIMVAQGMSAPLSLAGAVAGHPRQAGAASGLSSSLAMLISMAFAALAGISFDHSASTPGWLMLGSAALAWAAMRSALSAPVPSHEAAPISGKRSTA